MRSHGTHRAWDIAALAPLILAAVLALDAIRHDSITFDETNHFVSGLSYLETGDFRLAPETPPLAKMLAALPAYVAGSNWPTGDVPGWRDAKVWLFGHVFLFRMGNDPERLVASGRVVTVIMFLGLLLTVYAIGKILLDARAALFATGLAAISPTMLAHAHLVTTEIPVALTIWLTLLTFALLLSGPTARRILLAAASFGALCVSKFSWATVVPALLAMAVVAVRSRKHSTSEPGEGSKSPPEPSPKRSAVKIVGLFAAIGFTTWMSIWAVYGLRYAASRDETVVLRAWSESADEPMTQESAFELVLSAKDGSRGTGLWPWSLRLARTARLLPEAYLFGFAYTLKSAQSRPAYLMSEVSLDGFYSYFPVAFALKTPTPTMLLVLTGTAALIARWRRRGARGGEAAQQAHSRRGESSGLAVILTVGIAVFVTVYLFVAVASRFNIGHRHLLPVYPAVFLAAGASAYWLSHRLGRIAIACLALLAAAVTATTHPRYLSYFNEFAGGSHGAHRYLVDSNLDWGQGLKRLARYAERHPDETIKLSYFGTAHPPRYVPRVEHLTGGVGFAPEADLSAGTYVISATQLVGVYDARARADFWSAERLTALAAEAERLSAPLPADAPERAHLELAQARKRYDSILKSRLIYRLSEVPPDDRIGDSLFVYRLTTEDVRKLLEPLAPLPGD